MADEFVDIDVNQMIEDAGAGYRGVPDSTRWWNRHRYGLRRMTDDEYDSSLAFNPRARFRKIEEGPSL